MKKFVELTIVGRHEVLCDILKSMKNSSSKSFSFNKKKSDEYAENIFVDKENVAVFKSSLKSLYESFVWLSIKNNKLEVRNVTSSLENRLSISDYNRVIAAFKKDVVDSCKSDDATIVVTNEDVCLMDLISSDCAKALEKWAGSCNKSMPLSHPSDEDLWFEFLYETMKEEKRLSLDDLKKWLEEDEQWPLSFNEQIDEVLISYEYSLSLLDYYLRRNEN